MRSSTTAIALGLAAATILLVPVAAHAAAAPPPGASAPDSRDALLDVRQDVLVDRAFVPSAARPQGEVRIVRRGRNVVVQTLLYTRVLKRVFAAISEKERAGWPEGSDGHADMERYLAALEEFRLRAEKRTGPSGTEAERRVKALLEFVDAAEGPIVAVGDVEIEGSGEKVRVLMRPAPAVLALSAGYIRRNMRLIVADAFKTTPEEAAARLSRAGGS